MQSYLAETKSKQTADGWNLHFIQMISFQRQYCNGEINCWWKISFVLREDINII